MVLSLFSSLTKGHGTLATAHILFHEIGLTCAQLTFCIKHDRRLVVRRLDDGKLEMDFPSKCAVDVDIGAYLDEVCGVFGVDVGCVERVLFEVSSGKLFLVVDGYDSVVGVSSKRVNDLMDIDFGGCDVLVGVLEACGIVRDEVVRGVNVSTYHLEGTQFDGVYDIANRYFAPWVGIQEDPVNGWSHTILCTIYRDILGKEMIRSYCASERSGEVITRIGDEGRVKLIGSAKTVLVGKIYMS